MKRFLILMIVVLACMSAFGQKPAAQDQGGFMSWVQGAWKTVQDEGRPAVDRIAKQFPKRFQDMKSVVAGVSKRVHASIEAADLQQKKEMLLELWRVRKSLDMMTLMNPDALHSLTGLDTTGLKGLETQAKNLYAMVQVKINGR